MAKAEIGWTRTTEDGTKLDVYAQHVGKRWIFYAREKRFEEWQRIDKPPLEDWLELLDAARRKAQRMLLRPEEPGFIAKQIRERFPDAEFE
ncbi:hypothetical protein LBMAG56_13020 [Verrucomicrobiota bacterium]|nr:hypothetical protein LBMAG56_13020 [Verrucomicrobiota bacterium]